MVQLLTTFAVSDDEVGFLQHTEVLHHPEAGHLRKQVAQRLHRLPVAHEQGIEQTATRGVGQRLEHEVVVLHGSTLCDLLVTCQPPPTLGS